MVTIRYLKYLSPLPATYTCVCVCVIKKNLLRTYLTGIYQANENIFHVHVGSFLSQLAHQTGNLKCRLEAYFTTKNPKSFFSFLEKSRISHMKIEGLGLMTGESQEDHKVLESPHCSGLVLFLLSHWDAGHDLSPGY